MKIYCVDAFTAEPFAGNPAGVCVMEVDRDEGWMQSVAQEMNMSETAFLKPAGATFNLRWFTPVTEVDLCGHATLATAHIIWETGVAQGKEIIFSTRSGRLRARRHGDGIELDFPLVEVGDVTAPDMLTDALGIDKRNNVMRAGPDYLVELGAQTEVEQIAPDMAKLREIDMRGVIVTAPSDERGTDFVSRFFAPACGIDEDPVTGSAHCALAPYWAQRLGKPSLTAKQISSRGGQLLVTLADDRVLLRGSAVTVWRGEIGV